MLENRKKNFLIVVGAVLITLNIYCVAEADDFNVVERFVKIQCNADQVAEAVGDDSILPSYYKSYECHKLSGDTKDEAVINAKKDILQREANYWYAKKCDLLLSKNKLRKQYTQFLSDLKGSEEYEKIQRYYKENGRTVEEDILENQEYYESQFVINNLHLHFREKYDNCEAELNGKKYTEWEPYWNAIQCMVLNEYKKSDDYTNIMNGLDFSEKIIDNKQLVDKIISKGDDFSVGNRKIMLSKTNVYKDLSYSHKEIEVTK